MDEQLRKQIVSATRKHKARIAKIHQQGKRGSKDPRVVGEEIKAERRNFRRYIRKISGGRMVHAETAKAITRVLAQNADFETYGIERSEPAMGMARSKGLSEARRRTGGGLPGLKR